MKLFEFILKIKVRSLQGAWTRVQEICKTHEKGELQFGCY